MLARPDVEAVNVILPIEPLPEAVEKSLAAGKHVISEKPIAPDVATGRRLIQFARAYPKQVWMVAENDRYEPAFQQAGDLIRAGAIGKPLMASWSLPMSMQPDNKFYHTPWRRSGTFPGGFLLDGGVHRRPSGGRCWAKSPPSAPKPSRCAKTCPPPTPSARR
jgi:predicted dehydrogenase